MQLQNSELEKKIVLSHHNTSAEGFCASFAANRKLQRGKKKGGVSRQLTICSLGYWRSRTLPPLVHDEMFSFCDTLKKTAEHRSQITRTHTQHNQKLHHSACTTNLLWLRVHSQHSHGTPLTNSTLTSYIKCRNLSTWLGSKRKYWGCRVTKGIHKALKSKQGPRIYAACYEGLLLGGAKI